MRMLSKEERDEARMHYTQLGWPMTTVTHHEKTFDVFIIPTKSCPSDLPDAVARFTPSPEEIAAGIDVEQEAFFAVAETYPENVRMYPVLHEIIEFLEIGLQEPHHCSNASHEEAGLVMRSTTLTMTEKFAYVKQRLDFFRNLCKFAEARPKEYTSEDVREFVSSLRFFSALNGDK